jgi:hypothetical protein
MGKKKKAQHSDTGGDQPSASEVDVTVDVDADDLEPENQEEGRPYSGVTKPDDQVEGRPYS